MKVQQSRSYRRATEVGLAEKLYYIYIYMYIYIYILYIYSVTEACSAVTMCGLSGRTRCYTSLRVNSVSTVASVCGLLILEPDR